MVRVDMNAFERALGRDPEGPSYQPPTPLPRTVGDRVRAALWFRFGIGHRPVPRWATDEDHGRGRRG